MLTDTGTVLVVDDKEEDGLRISSALWKAGLPVVFVQYDEAKLVDARPLAGGVRVVFMDIELSGKGLATNAHYAFQQVVTALQKLLPTENGPWALISWSSNDDHAEAMFKFVRERLSGTDLPVAFGRLDKEAVNDTALLEAVKSKLDGIDAVRCLIGWEHAVRRAVASVLHGLACTAEKGGDTGFLDSRLRNLLLELATAEAGKAQLSGMEVTALYRLLSRLLADRLDASDAPSCALGTPSHEPQVQDEEGREVWRCQINTMLNLDLNPGSVTSPGALFDVSTQKEQTLPSDLDSTKKRETFIRGNYLDTATSDRKAVSKACRLYWLDITPPCDHANGKVIWRRFVLVCRVPWQFRDHIWRLDRETDKKEVGRLCRDNLYRSPVCADESERFILLVNADLQITIRTDAVTAQLGPPSMRLRELLMADWMGWIGRHITRRGHIGLLLPL